MTITQIPDKSQVVKVLLHYKNFYTSLAIICICMFLVFILIIPQFQQYGQQRAEIEEVEDRVSILENNISFLSKVNQAQQNTQLATVLAGLPDDKDYAGVLFAVRSASAKTGVGLGDFTFQVGELSQKRIITKNLPTLTLKLRVIGSPGAVGKFLQELSQTLPLSNVTEVKMNNASSEIVAEFYYKPIPQLQVNYTQPIVETPAQNKKILEELGKWRDEEPTFDAFLPSESSPSASPFGL